MGREGECSKVIMRCMPWLFTYRSRRLPNAEYSVRSTLSLGRGLCGLEGCRGLEPDLGNKASITVGFHLPYCSYLYLEFPGLQLFLIDLSSRSFKHSRANQTMHKATLAAFKASRRLGKYVADGKHFPQYSARIPISNLEKVRCAF